MGAAQRHPAGLTLVLLTLGVAETRQLMPSLRSWKAEVPWVFLRDILAFAVAISAIGY